MGLFDFLNSGNDRPGSILNDIFDRGSPLGSGTGSPLFDPFGVDEKREETQRMIKDAKGYVEDGKNIYNSALDKAEDAARKAQLSIDNYILCCEQTAKSIESDVTPVMKRFDDFHIDSRINNSIHIKEMRGSITIPQMRSVISSRTIMPGSGLFDWLIEDLKQDKAKEQLEKAKKYYSEMKVAQQKLLDTRDRLDRIRYRMDDEKREIEALTKKVTNITNQLQQAMTKTSFSSNDAAYYKGLRKIVEELAKMISTEFLGDNQSFTEKFKIQSDRIHEINIVIPSAPNINDYRLQEALRKLAEQAIRY